ncbi:unnamed protein product [Penicillium salamii]|uniref:Ubiquitin-like domain-containing protein n=1 Tax=Penicillium salamii TaxID=1612424 RepID=A0A9W4JDZ8_9EURO|nr:unnamed protein product [Penicillium salamii]
MASMEASSLPQPASGEPRNAITLHILCQSLPPPNRFTLHNVSLSITIAQLKERIEQAFPGNPRASTQRLIYRGKPLRVEDAVLSAIISIGEVGAQSSIHQMKIILIKPNMQEFNGSESIHLVLPPEPPKMEKSPVASGTSQASQIPEVLTQSSAPTSGTSTQFGTHPSVVPANAPSTPSIVRPALGTATPPYTTIQQIINNSSPALSGTNNHTPDVGGAEFSHRVRVMRRHIELIEQQLDHLTLPPMEHIISVRTQLLEIQDARYERRLPVPGVAELVGRIFNAQQRARLLDSAMMQRPSQVNPTESANASGSVERGAENSPPLYMLSSPTGDQSIIFTPNAMNAQLPAVQPTLPTRTAAGDPAAAQPHPNAAVVQNAVRHAMLNQRRRGNNIEHNGLARHMRRIWLFTRLWFFCYLTSAPGTWRRYIFVSLALLATFLSETDIPQQFLRSVIAPAQRHLESLAHAGGPLDPSAQATNGAPGLTLWEQIRRLERSIVLLVASLIPGLGERQVQARHAAERAREVAEQERAQQEAAAAQEHTEQNDESGPPDAAPAVDAGTGDGSGNVRVE